MMSWGEGLGRLVRVRQPVSVNANEIRFSQSSVNGAEEIISSMKANGWKGDRLMLLK